MLNWGNVNCGVNSSGSERSNAEFSTYPDKVVGEEPPPTVQLSLPPAPLILPDVTDDVTDSDGQLVIMLGLVIKLHNGFHWERGKQTERFSAHSYTQEAGYTLLQYEAYVDTDFLHSVKKKTQPTGDPFIFLKESICHFNYHYIWPYSRCKHFLCDFCNSHTHPTKILFLVLLPFYLSLTSSYSYSSENMGLNLLHRALIMRRVLTEPGKKNPLHSIG